MSGATPLVEGALSVQEPNERLVVARPASLTNYLRSKISQLYYMLGEYMEINFI